MGTVYLLHFDRPISPDHSRSLAERLADHAAGRGARLTQVARERGIGWQCVKTWEGTRGDERRFKNRKQAPRYCPICNGRAARQWKERGVLISHKGRQHSIHTLPKWAQETIASLMRQREQLSTQVRHLDSELRTERQKVAACEQSQDLITADDLPF